MSKPREYLPELMDKTRAIIACGAGTKAELAKYAMPDTAHAQITVSKWFAGIQKPNAESTLRIQSWCAVKTVEIDAAGEEMREKYRREFAKTATGKKR